MRNKIHINSKTADKDHRNESTLHIDIIEPPNVGRHSKINRGIIKFHTYMTFVANGRHHAPGEPARPCRPKQPFQEFQVRRSADQPIERRTH